ncbi:lytic transglycosylase domain-containing protein [Campylobacter helveticus]|uniref:Lytic transglycosylase domain-containing protein n=1 Tax=Campylobacter helveticus TaxID=28898 RepID=A0ABY3L2N1_9BACT|nr:lytic transglycosylase domain-containing protein [Campylobacter helveticus]MCR2039391.1 lytic transglycosylase domain-containing protein [Campylobacter helveticus]TXK57714.1 lytic transglycosylase domain-containing protein [Campylobacter helveticus]
MRQIFIITFLITTLSANYYIEAGKRFGIDPQLLWTIAYKESRLNPNIISKKNKNGSYDIGIMQINSIHLPRLKKQYGISKEDLLNPKINIFIGAEILKMCFNKHGLNEKAITCYNGRIKNNNYGKEVLSLLKEARENNGRVQRRKYGKN